LFLWDIDYNVIANLNIAYEFLLLSALFSLAFRYFGVMIWRNILYDLGSKQLPHFKILAVIYAKAWMARYIPGTVTWVAGKVFLAQNLGISNSRLTAATLLEIATQIVSLAIVSLFLIGFDERLKAIISVDIKILVGILMVVLMILITPKVFNFFIRKAYKFIANKEASEELSVNGKSVARSFVTYTFGAFLSGTVAYFLALSIWGELSSSDYLYIVGATNMAAVIGMLTPLVPSGFGTRDASLLVLLSVILPKEIALAITVASRLWTAIVDVLFFISCYLLAGNKVRNYSISKQQD